MGGYEFLSEALDSRIQNAQTRDPGSLLTFFRKNLQADLLRIMVDTPQWGSDAME